MTKAKTEAQATDQTPAERRAAYPRDTKGFVVLKQGDAVAKVLPESVEVWVSRGWEVSDEELPQNAPEADPFSGNPDDPENLEN